MYKTEKTEQDKILTFVINEHNELLILKGGENDPQFMESFWYVVTGSCEDFDSDFVESVKREVKEETDLDVLETMYLNWIFKYHSLGDDCVEIAYFSKVKKSEITLNEESIGYKWCDLNEFIDLIKWYGSKEVLRKVLEKAFENEVYFKEEVIEEYS